MSGMPVASRLQPGSLLGPYQIGELLGAGGMGEVYRAVDPRLRRDVAVKVLPPHLAHHGDARARFEREARAAASLAHPNILAIHDFGLEGDLPYVVMELLQGDNLRVRIRAGRMPWKKCVDLAVNLAEGLAAAHAKKIVHRDLKPENIFLTNDGRLKILDFGLARLEETESDPNAEAQETFVRTSTGVVLGTIGYLSPEQVRGEVAETPADIFAFGCVLYELITGERAFARETGAETLAAILKEEPAPLPETAAPPEVAAIVRRCLEKDPAERFQSARDLAFTLRALLAGPDTAAVPRGKAAKKTGLTVGIFPFASSDPALVDLSDAVSEEVMNRLSSVPKLRIVARGTMFHYKGEEHRAREIGRELGVDYVLTGRASSRSQMTSVQAELVDVSDGSQVWGEQYNRRGGDLFALQEELGSSIATAIQKRLKLKSEPAKKAAANTEQAAISSAISQLCLKARTSMNRATEEGLRSGAELFRTATGKQPPVASAFAGVAESLALLAMRGIVAPAAVESEAYDAAARACEIDPASADARAVRALVTALFTWDRETSERELAAAIQQAPASVVAHQYFAWVLAAGSRFDDAVREIRQAVELDDASSLTNSLAASVFYFAGKLPDAVQ